MVRVPGLFSVDSKVSKFTTGLELAGIKVVFPLMDQA
jgi:hypothetical protein